MTNIYEFWYAVFTHHVKIKTSIILLSLHCSKIYFISFQVKDRELYNDTDTEVKQQIWKDNQSLFGDEVSPLLSQYIKEKENILFDHQNLTNLFFSPSPKVWHFVKYIYIVCLLIFINTFYIKFTFLLKGKTTR